MPPARLGCGILSQIRHMRANMSLFWLRAGLRQCRRGQFTFHNPNATRFSRTALAAEAAVAATAAVRLAPESAPRAAPANATRLQPDVAAAVCAPAPAQVCFAGIPGSFERGLFVHSYPARVYLIVANERLLISFVGDDRCRFVCRSSNANWRPSSCALRCIVRASLGAVG